jgi:hypothetical protein
MTCIQGYELNISIDWATRKHDICTEFHVEKRSFDINMHTPQHIDELMMSLHQKYHVQIAVACVIT